MTEPCTPDDALAFFREVVEPTAAEFLALPDDKRRGVLAALAVAAMTEHYFHACPDLARDGDAALANLKGALRRENAAIGWIADVANATKHVHRHRPDRLGYSDVSVVRTGVMGTMRVGWPMGHGQEVVVGPNAEWRLVTLLEEALRFWRVRLRL